jgi:hypothetical protein
LHFFHILHLTLFKISSSYIYFLLSSFFIACLVLTRFLSRIPHFNFLLVWRPVFMCCIVSVQFLRLCKHFVSFPCLLLSCATCICISCLYIVSCARQVGLALDLGCYQSVQQGCWKFRGAPPLPLCSLRKSATPVARDGQRPQSS